MDIKRPGFTIIELVVAMAIVAMLMAVAIPQLTGFSRQEDFAARAQKVADCLQDGQFAAAQGTNGAEFVVVTVQSENDKTTCQQDFYGAWNKDGGLLTLTDLQVNKLSAVAVPLDSVDPVTIMVSDLVVEQNYQVYFAATERGVPVLYAQLNQVPEPVSGVLGDGQAGTISLQDPHAENSQGKIFISSFGSPITYEAD